jgi:hypothetical protein
LRADRATIVADEIAAYPLRGLGMLVEDSADLMELTRMHVTVEGWNEHELVWQDAAHRGSTYRPRIILSRSPGCLLCNFSPLEILIQELTNQPRAR